MQLCYYYRSSYKLLPCPVGSFRAKRLMSAIFFFPSKFLRMHKIYGDRFRICSVYVFVPKQVGVVICEFVCANS